MPVTPLGSESYVSAAITNMAMAYRQTQTDFIGTKFAPVVTSDKPTGRYFTFGKAEFLSDNMQRRGSGERANRGGFRLSDTGYTCETWALGTSLSNQDRGSWDEKALGNVDRVKAEWLMMQNLQRFERQWAADFFVTGVWGTSTTPATLWSTSTSTPIENVQVGLKTVKKNTGYKPNTMVVGYDVHDVLVRHPDIVDIIKHTSSPGNPAIANEETLAKVFGVKRYMVCQAVKNTANENATFSGDFIQGKHALLAYVADAPSVEEPSAAYTFAWTGVGEGRIAEEIAISQWYDQDTRSDIWEIEASWDNVITGSDLGYMFVSVVS